MAARSKPGTSIVENRSSASVLPRAFISEIFASGVSGICQAAQIVEMAFSRLSRCRKIFLSLGSYFTLQRSEEFNVDFMPFLVALRVLRNYDEAIGLH
jgi:hypothetical protein